MRYIGSKDNLLNFIEHAVVAQGITSGTFCDLFAGTTVVGRHFKRKGFRVISNDLMTYSYAFGKAYIENNAPPSLSGLALSMPPRAATLFADCPNELAPLQDALTWLNGLPPEPGFIYRHYSDEGTHGQEHTRMYFSATNAGKIDAIRTQVQQWFCSRLVTEAEFYILLSALLEAVPSVSNTSGTYGAFLKFWETRSQKLLTLTVPPLCADPSQQAHQAFQCDAGLLSRNTECHVLYLDPPYNQRQYAPNYHILETIARWDEPLVKGVSGLRPYQNEKSTYCRTDTALLALADIAQNARCHLLMLSYNSEGIMPHDDIMSTLRQRGPVQVVEQSYRRYRSDSDNEKRNYKSNKNVTERIYMVAS